MAAADATPADDAGWAAPAAAFSKPDGPAAAASPPPPPRTWTVEQVGVQLGAKGAYDWADKKLVRKLAQRGVDGAALLGLTKKDLREGFGIRELGRIKRILRGVEKLKRAHEPPSPRQQACPTPDVQAFDVPISEEDLVPTACRSESPRGEEEGGGGCTHGFTPFAPQPPPERPPPPSPTPLAAAPHAFQNAFSEIDCDVDIIELEDLVPENRRCGEAADADADEPREIPQRPVTAIGHRPADGVRMHENGHRHVWADDPAVHIRRASDLLHDHADDDELPPEVLFTLSGRELNNTRARPAPVPRPPAAMAGVARLPCGNRTPDWVQASWSGPADGEKEARRRRPSAGAVAAAAKAAAPPSPQRKLSCPAAKKSGAAPHGIELSAPPYDHGILERERQFSDLQRLFTLWVTNDTDEESSSDQRFISYDCLAAMLTRYAGWTEDAAEAHLATAISSVDGMQPRPVRLDWHDFFGFLTRVTAAMPPTAFDNLVSFFTNAINEETRHREDARRAQLLAAVFDEVAAEEDPRGGPRTVPESKLQALLTSVAGAADAAVGDALLHELRGVGGDLRRDAFVQLLTRALRAASFSEFDLIVFRLKRLADAHRNPALYAPSGALPIGTRPPNPHLQPLTSDALEAIVGLSPATAPLIIMGAATDPSVPIAECAASCGVALRLQFVSSDEAATAALKAIAGSGFSHGDWICLVLDAHYKATDRFLRSVGVKLQTEAPWPIHRKFRLWIYTPTVIPVPSILSMRSVLVDTEAFDLPALLKVLQTRGE